MALRFPDDWPIEETERQAKDGSLLLWMVWDDDRTEHLGAVGTHVMVKPSGKRLVSISWAAGREHRKWARMAADALEEYARQQNCTTIAIEGRGGWLRSVEGYRPVKWSVLAKEL